MDSQQLRRRQLRDAGMRPNRLKPMPDESAPVDPTAPAVSPYPGAPQMTNYDPNAVPLEAAPVAAEPAPSVSPFADPMFDRYFAVANAGMPGQPGALGGGPLPDAGVPAVGQPNAETAPTRNVQLTVEAPKVGNFGAGSDSQKKPSYGGRFGRRQESRAQSSMRRR